jgi:uncharacterized membrane protein HdeD (DUF308 family)
MAISQALLNDMSRGWWVILLRGIVGVLFGVLAFAWPGATLLALVLVWGVYAIFDGAFALYQMVLAARQDRRWWPYLLEGLVGIGAGVMAFAWPEITALALVLLIAAWAIVTGVFEIIAAIDLRKQVRHEWLLGLSGVLSILLGLLVMAQPDAGALAVVWLLGAYALLFGVTLIGLAFRVRGLGRNLLSESQPDHADVDSRKVA